VNGPEDPPSDDRETAFGDGLESEVEELMAQEAAVRTSLELADRLPPPSLDDFLS